MQSVRIFVAGCAVALAGVTLSGCAPGEPVGPISSAAASPTTLSLFASHDEALSAASAAFQKYLDVDADLANSPSADLSRVYDVARGSAADQEVADLEDGRRRGVTQTGATTFDNARYEYSETDQDGTVHVHTFLCVDFTNTRVVDSSGADVTPLGRDDRIELRAEFVSRTPGSADLILERTTLWARDGAC